MRQEGGRTEGEEGESRQRVKIRESQQALKVLIIVAVALVVVGETVKALVATEDDYSPVVQWRREKVVTVKVVMAILLCGGGVSGGCSSGDDVMTGTGSLGHCQTNAWSMAVLSITLNDRKIIEQHSVAVARKAEQ